MSQELLAGKATHVMRVAVDEATARRISDLLFEQLDPSETAVAAAEAERGWTVEVHFLREPDRERLAALVRDAAGRGQGPEISFERIAATDWVAASLAGLSPVRVGRFVVHGAHDREKVAPNRIGIEIEATLAFGTGHHGTTQGCLAAIERATRMRRPQRILDLGTGTGVLAIAAARGWRQPVVASEIDPWAVTTAKINARANRAGAYVAVVRADGTRHAAIRASAPYDFVLANILLKPLQALARPVRGLLAHRAVVVLSGLLPSQANAALAAWRSQGLVLRRRDTIENWTTLTLVHAARRRGL